MAAQDVQGQTAPGLAAALCEMQYWEQPCNELLLDKALLLEQAGEGARAYETLCRIPNYGLDQAGRRELMRRKLLCTYSAEMMEEFCGLLDEAAGYGLMEGITLEDKPKRLDENVAMLLSVIPGAGLAYAGDWKNAGKYFLLNGGIIALGAGAYTQGLYVSAFLGGGMLLYNTLPKSTEMAVEAAAAYNSRALQQYYAPVYEALLNRDF